MENQTPPEQSPSSQTPPPSLSLLGPDGKPLNQPKRQMMGRREKFNMVFMIFTLMDRQERLMLLKMLKPLRKRLDLMYPNGMSEKDIERDVEKVQSQMQEEADASVQKLSDSEGHAVAQEPQGDAQSSVPAQQDAHKEGEESGAVSEESGC